MKKIEVSEEHQNAINSLIEVAERLVQKWSSEQDGLEGDELELARKIEIVRSLD